MADAVASLWRCVIKRSSALLANQAHLLLKHRSVIYVTNLDVTVLNMVPNDRHNPMVPEGRLQRVGRPVISKRLEKLVLHKHQDAPDFSVSVLRGKVNVVAQASLRISFVLCFVLDDRLLQNVVVKADRVFLRN